MTNTPLDPYRRAGLERNPFAYGADDMDAGPFIDHLGVAPPTPGAGEFVQLLGERGVGKSTHLRRWQTLQGGTYHHTPADGPVHRPPVEPLVFWDEADRMPRPMLRAALREAAAVHATVVVGTHRDLTRVARKAGLEVVSIEFEPLSPALLREWTDTRIASVTRTEGTSVTISNDDLAAVLATPEGQTLRGAGDLLHRLVAHRVRTTLACFMLVLLAACGGEDATPTHNGAAAEATTITTTADAATTAPPSTTAPSTTAPSTTAPSTTAPSTTARTSPPTTAAPLGVQTGAAALVASDFEVLDGQRVGLIANQTSTVDGVHLIDLLSDAPNVELVAIFAPEHGVRGTADAGELVDDEVDLRTNTPILSLYGSTRQPTLEMFENIDVIVFDLQDVGARYYTYISTMGLAMQTAAEAGLPFVVLDRPNPAGGERVSGFTRVEGAESFISQYPIPSVYGLTPGELARLIVAEAWMPGVEGLELTVIELGGWSRSMFWDDTQIPWTPPSPGLPFSTNGIAYPAFVQLEATSVSYGSGTFDVFTMVGAPWVDAELLTADLAARSLPGVWFEPVTFVPEVIPNVSVRPRFEGETVHGAKLTITDPTAFDPVGVGVHIVEALLTHAEVQLPDGLNEDGEPVIDRPSAFDRLAGSPELRRQLEAGVPAADIVAGWAAENEAFRALRASALLYD